MCTLQKTMTLGGWGWGAELMRVFVELSCAEQVQIQKYKTHAYKTPKTAGVQTIMLKHPTRRLKKVPIKPKYRINVPINNPNHTN